MSAFTFSPRGIDSANLLCTYEWDLVLCLYEIPLYFNLLSSGNHLMHVNASTQGNHSELILMSIYVAESLNNNRLQDILFINCVQNFANLYAVDKGVMWPRHSLIRCY